MAALRKLDTAKDSGHEKPFLRRYCLRKLELVALVSQVGLLRVRFLAAKARVGKSGHPHRIPSTHSIYFRVGRHPGGTPKGVDDRLQIRSLLRVTDYTSLVLQK